MGASTGVCPFVRALKEIWLEAMGTSYSKLSKNPSPFQKTMIRTPTPSPCRSYRALFIVERSERRRSNSAAAHVAHTDL